jgi:hypothetical protein
MRKTRDLCDNSGAEINELQYVEQEQHELSHEAEDASASDVATHILNSSPQAIKESPIKEKQLQEEKCPKKEIQKINNVIKKKCYPRPKGK